MDKIVVPDSTRRWDCLSLGEVMLRLDPGDGRIHTTRHFNVWEGGGEYNVARGLRRCFGLRTAIATALADNPVGRLVEDLILQGGVDPSLIRWVPYDGVGRTVRNGLNFTERGFGTRAAAGCSDRGHTAISQVKPGDFDWATIFGTQNGSKWFHLGGIFAALSSSTAEVAADAMDAARAAGTPISYDLNFRDSLWKSIGGKTKAQEVNRDLVRKVDLLLGNEVRRLPESQAHRQHPAHRAHRHPQRLGRHGTLRGQDRPRSAARNRNLRSRRRRGQFCLRPHLRTSRGQAH